MYNESHYDIRRILELKGYLKVEVSSSIYGDPENSPSVFGTQIINLNKDNTSISFHAFVESNKKLRKHHSLEINIEDETDVEFK